MQVLLWRALVQSISSFLSLSSYDNFDSQPILKNYQNIEEILKLLKPIVDAIIDTNVASDENKFSKTLEQLVTSIGEWQELSQNWNPLASRVHLVLQAELLTVRIQTCILKISRLLKDLHQSELSSKSLELCIEKANISGCESTSTIIGKAIQDHAVGQELTPERLAKIADCLGLRSNQEILIEVVALEKLRESAENVAQVSYIDQLIALFTYTHDRLFISKISQSRTLVPMPAVFICPLSLELMRDPVIVASGQTYERAYISKWLDLGLTICPKTRQRLNHTNLIPNYTSRALILNWCEVNHAKLPDPLKSVNEPLLPFLFWNNISDTEALVKELVKGLQSDSVEDLRRATAKLLVIAKQNMDNRVLISDYGGIKLLVNLLASSDPQIQENAVTVLLYLAINHDNKVTITDANAIEPLIHVLLTGTPEARENSAATLFCLSMIDKNKSMIGRFGAIGPLVKLLREGTPGAKKNAVIALFNLSIADENRVQIVRAGGVNLLVDLIKDPSDGMVDKAVAVLESLSRVFEGRDAICEAGVIPILVDVLELGSLKGKENAAAVLLRLCIWSSRASSIVLKEGVVPPLMALSLSGSPRAKEKALSLLRYLRN